MQRRDAFGWKERISPYRFTAEELFSDVIDMATIVDSFFEEIPETAYPVRVPRPRRGPGLVRWITENLEGLCWFDFVNDLVYLSLEHDAVALAAYTSG